jgi:hypothetical protein
MADEMMDEGQDSITIPRSVLGDRKCKPGEKLTFTVTDVDPDTGDVEATLGGYAEKGGSSNGGSTDMSDEMASYPMD